MSDWVSRKPLTARCFDVGIDFGTSGTRALVIDANGTVQAEVSLALEPVEPSQCTQAWQNNLFELFRQMPRSLRSHFSHITIAGTSSTVVLCDGQGMPLHPPLMYNEVGDRTAVDTLKSIVPAGQPVLSASSSLVKLLFLLTQVKRSQARYLLHQADWLAFTPWPVGGE